MKKILSMAMVLAMLVTMFVPVVQAEASVEPTVLTPYNNFSDYVSKDADGNPLYPLVAGTPSYTGVFWSTNSVDVQDVTGVFGKADTDKSAKFDFNGTPGTLIFSFGGSKATDNVRVSAELATDTIAAGTNFGILTKINDNKAIAAGDEGVAFLFNTDHNSKTTILSFGENVTPEGFVLEANRFYKIDIVFIGTSGIVDIYLDGVKLVRKDINSILTKSGLTFSKVGYSFISAKRNSANDGYLYLDNTLVYAYPQDVYPEITYGSVLNNGYNKIALGKEDITVAEFKNTLTSSTNLIFKDSAGNVKNDSDIINAGDKIYEQITDSVCCYTFVKATNIVNFTYGDTTYAEDGTLAPYSAAFGHNFWDSKPAAYGVGGVYGKASDDIALHLKYGVNGGGRYFYGGSGLTVNQLKDNYVHISAELATNSLDFKEFALRQRYNSASEVDVFTFYSNGSKAVIKILGEDVAVEGFTYQPNHFYKVDIVYLGSTGVAEFYLDGKKIYTKENAGYLASATIDRMFIKAFKNTTSTVDFYIDNVVTEKYPAGTYLSFVYDENAFDLALNENSPFGMKDDNIYLGNYTNVTVAEFKGFVSCSNAFGFVNSNGVTLADNDVITSGSKIVEHNSGYKKYYTFVKPELLAEVTYSDYTDATAVPAGHILWLDSKNYTMEVASGSFGKAADDKTFKFNISGVSGDAVYYPVNAQNKSVNDYNVHFSAAMAVSSLGFKNIGLRQRFDNDGNKTLIPLNISSDHNKEITVTSFGNVIELEDFDFEAKRFYKMDVVYRGVDRKADVYLDGVLINTGDIPEGYSKITHGFAIGNGYTTNNVHYYMDDLVTTAYPKEVYPPVVFDSSLSVDIDNIYVENGTTAEEILAKQNENVKIYDVYNAKILSGSDVVCNGASLIALAKDGKTLVYNKKVLMPYGDIAFEKYANSLSDGTSVSTYRAKVKFTNCGVEKSFKIILASYLTDASGNKVIEKIETKDVTLAPEVYSNYFTEKVTLNIPKAEDDVEGRTFKVFLWSDAMEPLCVPVSELTE